MKPGQNFGFIMLWPGLGKSPKLAGAEASVGLRVQNINNYLQCKYNLVIIRLRYYIASYHFLPAMRNILT